MGHFSAINLVLPGQLSATINTFALIVMATYGLLTMPILARRGFDSSAFINAGDMHVDVNQMVSPIIVLKHRYGYDGQFYYRLALSPFGLQQQVFGIQFDSQPWRMQRIVYPLLVWGVTFGHAALVPAAMFLVNLLGLGAIAIVALRLSASLNLPAQTPIAILLWPGFFIALTHDTAEIITAALLLSAIYFYLAKRLIAYAVFGALATLTRETSILFLGGILCFEMLRAVQCVAVERRWQHVLICGLALVPFVVWQEALYLVLGHTPQEVDGYAIVSWPFRGVATMLRDTATGVRQFAPIRGDDVVIRAYELVSATWLLVFCAIVVARARATWHMAGTTAALAAGWFAVFILMSTLTADGPWVDPFGYFRAFTECYVVGCLLFAQWPVRRWLAAVMFAGGTVAYVGAWALSVIAVGYAEVVGLVGSN